MDLKLNIAGPQGETLSSGEESYQESQIYVTRTGGITAAMFLSCFALLYGALDYPRPIVLVNLAALVIDLGGLWLLHRRRSFRPAAHIITFATYLSLFGTTLFMGGIDGSSIVWLVFVPTVATIMAGIRDGIV